MSEIDSIAEELFFKLRNRFPKIQMGNEEGKVTTDPLEARFFNLDYRVDGDTHGVVTCSLIDPQAMKIYYNTDITEHMDETQEDEWFSFLKELRKFAKSNMLMFDVRDITKDSLDQKDIDFVSKHQKSKTKVEESRVTWARRGRYSEGNQESIKIHVVHSNKMEENPNNRLSKIDKIYLVNSKGEKFLLPFKSTTGAKVMAHHTAKGGTPYDEGGQIISKAMAEMKNLQRFAMANRNKQFENDEPEKVLTATKHLKEVMRKHLLKMADDRDFDTHLTELAKLVKLDDARADEDIKNWFVQKTYNENLDAWIESAANAYHKYEEMMMNEMNPTGAEDLGEPSPDMTQVRAKNPAKIGDTVKLYADPAKDKEMQELIRKQPMRGMVRLILADISKRAVDDEVAILASKADEGEMTRRHMDMIKAYVKDLYSGHPDRMEPVAKKDIHGKAKTAEEEFESAIMGLGEDECPHCGMSPCHCGDHDHSMKQEEMEEAGAQSEEDQMAEELDALLIAGGDYDKLLRQLAKKYKTQPEVVEYNYEQWLESPIQNESKDKKPDVDDDDSHSARKKIHADYEERWGNKRPDDWRYGIDEPSLTRNDPDVDEGIAGAAWELGKGAVKVPAKALGRAAGSAAAGIAKGAGQIAGGAMKGVGNTLQGKPLKGIGQTVKGAAVGSGQAIGGTLKGIGKGVSGLATDVRNVASDVKRAWKKESVKETEGMEAGVCNETPEGTMCPVHGMEECSYGTMESNDHKEHNMDHDLKELRRLSGLTENYIYAQEEETDEDKKPDADGDGVPDWADKKPGKDDQDEDMEEGNEFSGARADAVAKHQDHFTVGGKTYKVTEVDMSEGEKEEEDDEEWHDKDGNRDPHGAHDAGGHYHADREADKADYDKMDESVDPIDDLRSMIAKLSIR